MRETGASVAPTDRDPTSRVTELVIQRAAHNDIAGIKAIADRERATLGFIHRGALMRAADRGELLVATVGDAVIGFCHFYRRQDRAVTLYHLAVESSWRDCGAGRALLVRLHEQSSAEGYEIVRLRCPTDLPANGFYARLGYRAVATLPGKARPLNVLELVLLEAHC